MRGKPHGCPQAVNSYEGEGAVVLLLIFSDEYGFDESRIGMEVERPRRAAGRVGAGPTEIWST
jgi:hypothetical protein